MEVVEMGERDSSEFCSDARRSSLLLSLPVPLLSVVLVPDVDGVGDVVGGEKKSAEKGEGLLLLLWFLVLL